MATTLAAALSPERREQLFPKLTPAQIKRIAAVGKPRQVDGGQMLIHQGDATVPFFVVISGEIEILQPTANGELPITNHLAGEFTGEVNMLSGRRSLVCARMKEAGEVIQLDRHGLQTLVQTDVELSEILMRAFIFRRLE